MVRTLFKDSRQPYFWCERALLDLGLSPTEIAVYCVLAAYTNKEDQCWPSYDTIAGRLGITRRTAIRSVKRLHGMGLLKKSTFRHAKSQQRVNLYELVDLPSPVGGDTTGGGGDMRAPTVVTPEHLPWCHQSTCNKEPLNKDTENKEKAPPKTDPSLEAFALGFKRLYGHRPQFSKKQLETWCQRRAECPEETLTAKIAAWWTHPLPKNFTGNRTFGAFLQWFDGIPVNGSQHNQTGVIRSQDDWMAQMRSGSPAGIQHYRELTNGITDPAAIIQTLKQYGGVNDDDDAQTIINACNPTRRTTGTDGAGSDLL